MHDTDSNINYFKTTWRPNKTYLEATSSPQASCLWHLPCGSGNIIPIAQMRKLGL